MTEYFNLIFFLLIAIGVALFLGGVALSRLGRHDVGGVTMWIGGVCAAGGFVGELSLREGALDLFALLAVMFACVALLGPPAQRIGSALLALGLGVWAVSHLPGHASPALSAITIIALILGAASLVNGLLRRGTGDQAI